MVRQCASGHVRERCEAGTFLCMFCFSMSDVSPLDSVLPVFSKTIRRLLSFVLFHDSDVCILFIVRGANMLALVNHFPCTLEQVGELVVRCSLPKHVKVIFVM